MARNVTQTAKVTLWTKAVTRRPTTLRHSWRFGSAPYPNWAPAPFPGRQIPFVTRLKEPRNAASPPQVRPARKPFYRRELLTPGQAEEEVAFHVRPFGGEHAVHDRVANGAIAPRLVVTDDAVLPGA